MLAIHPQARTTPAVRAEIARSPESSGVLAKRYGVSTETIRKWRKRGPGDCQDRSARPHKLPWKASDEERAIVCALRRATSFSLDDLTFIITHFLPHLNRDAVYRILKAEGLNRLPPAQRTRKPHGSFKDYDVGFVHMGVKHLPKLQTGFNVAYNGRRQRVLKGRSTDIVLRERLKAKPKLAKPVTKPPDPEALPKALKVVARAKEVSHPDIEMKAIRHSFAVTSTPSA